jgi:TetR/AcrR family acrAB operon transcriptional repressor
MARRTKQDALATRDSILDAAELLFEQQGVSRTTLQHIASAANVTRGAIYWHFQDKATLFNAMMDRAVMPLESALECVEGQEAADPIGDIKACLMTAFRLTVNDPKTRRVFEIATHKVEYVEELNAVRDRHLASYDRWLQRFESRLKLAVKRGLLQPDTPVRTVAIALWAITDGLIRIWLLNPSAFNLVRVGRQVVDAHLDGFRMPAAANGAP